MIDSEKLLLNFKELYPLIIALLGIYFIGIGLKQKTKTDDKEKVTEIKHRSISIYIGFSLIIILISTIILKNCIIMEKYPITKQTLVPPDNTLTLDLSTIAAFAKDKPLEECLIINLTKQELTLIKDNKPLHTYPISSSKYGIGNKADSNKTPLGIHRIKTKIGADAPIGAIFKSRQNTNKIADIITEPIDVPEDYVTTRILWLEGLEPKINLGKGVDSYKRHIYIHGTPEEGLIGTPASHGCIRLKNTDVIELFNKVSVNTLVLIKA